MKWGPTSMLSNALMFLRVFVLLRRKVGIIVKYSILSVRFREARVLYQRQVLKARERLHAHWREVLTWVLLSSMSWGRYVNKGLGSSTWGFSWKAFVQESADVMSVKTWLIEPVVEIRAQYEFLSRQEQCQGKLRVWRQKLDGQDESRYIC